MYQKYFGLKEMPFTLSPDTSYFFAYGHYANALNTLLVALRTGEGFIKVSGEVGTGKTLLCRKLMRSLGDRFELVYIPNPQLSSYGLQVAVAEELGLKITRYVHRLNKMITDRLLELAKQGRRVVLCIDEAQAMPEETMESLRLLTNLETEKSKLLHVVLFGQPELDELLSKKSVRQLKQRITFSYQLQPLERVGMDAYIMHRLVVAGFIHGNIFEPRALDRLFKASKGIPRLINVLCHKSLMVTFGQGGRVITEENVQLAISDTEDTQLKSTRVAWWRRLVASFAAVTIIASVSGYIGIVS
ncbi:MSHA biogenesis protein MshM [hydrothermal vent metagenome]|uniref:MSHA biogenesis protein MshM n=1 Tax=hydrothermal vent metagenome TaxID=652676 RepID=A0A3B0ZC10_9ZZZZ